MSETVTKVQVSAGGVAFRQTASGIEVVLISVGEQRRWQLPKGLVNQGETNEAAALREVREEAGIHTELVQPIDHVEYWFYAGKGSKRVRFHKFVYFFLLRYASGDVRDHDHEVNEAHWFDIREAAGLLAFKGEQEILSKAMQLLAEMDDPPFPPDRDRPPTAFPSG